MVLSVTTLLSSVGTIVPSLSELEYSIINGFFLLNVVIFFSGISFSDELTSLISS